SSTGGPSTRSDSAAGPAGTGASGTNAQASRRSHPVATATSTMAAVLSGSAKAGRNAIGPSAPPVGGHLLGCRLRRSRRVGGEEAEGWAVRERLLEDGDGHVVDGDAAARAALRRARVGVSVERGRDGVPVEGLLQPARPTEGEDLLRLPLDG